MYSYYREDNTRVTLCFFSGSILDGGGWWETDEGGRVEKRKVCKQVTVDGSVYHHLRKGDRQEAKKSFNDEGIFECKNGCASLDHTVLKASSQQVSLAFYNC